MLTTMSSFIHLVNGSYGQLFPEAFSNSNALFMAFSAFQPSYPARYSYTGMAVV